MKNKLFYIVFALFNILFLIYYAQSGEKMVKTWIKQKSGTNKDLFSVFFINSNYGFISGDSGVFLKTSNGGNNWEIINLPISVDEKNPALRSIFFIDKFNGFVTTNKATLLKTTDGCKSWKIVNPGFKSKKSKWDNWIEDMYFTNNNTGYINYNDTLYKTNDGGNTWIKVYAGANSILYFTDSINGYIMTYDPKIIYKTIDGGKDWIKVKDYSHPSNMFIPNATKSYKYYGFYGRYVNLTCSFTFQYLSSGIVIGVGCRDLIKSNIGHNNWEIWGPYCPDLEKNSECQWIHDVYFISTAIGYVVGNEGTIYKKIREY